MTWCNSVSVMRMIFETLTAYLLKQHIVDAVERTVYLPMKEHGWYNKYDVDRGESWWTWSCGWWVAQCNNRPALEVVIEAQKLAPLYSFSATYLLQLQAVLSTEYCFADRTPRRSRSCSAVVRLWLRWFMWYFSSFTILVATETQAAFHFQKR